MMKAIESKVKTKKQIETGVETNTNQLPPGMVSASLTGCSPIGLETDQIEKSDRTTGQVIAKKRRMKVALVTVSFVTDDVGELVDDADLIVLNETEARQLKVSLAVTINEAVISIPAKERATEALERQFV